MYVKSKASVHLAWADLKKTGSMQEIAVVKHDQSNDDIWYIPIADLDEIDRKRLIKILSKRDAHKYPLFELLAMETLPNGMGALEYFHQLVRIRTVEGEIFTVNSGKRGKPKQKKAAVASGELEERKAGRPPTVK